MKITIIGAGNVGGAIAHGTVKGCVTECTNVVVANPFLDALQRLQSDLGINISTDNVQAVQGADVIIIAVKPWLVETILTEIRPVLDYSKQIIVSVAAGLTFDTLTNFLNRGDGVEPPVIFRVMPNTAMSLMKSVTFISSCRASEEQVALINNMFASMGESIIIEEDMMIAGTSLASCGVAFALKYIDAAINGGEELGFSVEESRRIVIGTIKGALGLLDFNDTMPQTEIDKVTTPGGVTLKGLDAMKEAGFTHAVLEGLRKSH